LTPQGYTNELNFYPGFQEMPLDNGNSAALEVNDVEGQLFSNPVNSLANATAYGRLDDLSKRRSERRARRQSAAREGLTSKNLPSQMATDIPVNGAIGDSPTREGEDGIYSAGVPIHKRREIWNNPWMRRLSERFGDHFILSHLQGRINDLTPFLSCWKEWTKTTPWLGSMVDHDKFQFLHLRRVEQQHMQEWNLNGRGGPMQLNQRGKFSEERVKLFLNLLKSTLVVVPGVQVGVTLNCDDIHLLSRENVWVGLYQIMKRK
jgi:hypothetical protein